MNPTHKEIANRANASKSTGPNTAEGKEKSSKNAVTHALTGRTVLLPGDELAQYEQHVRSYLKQFKPLTDYELGLVQALADTDWRLHRIPHLMMALQAKGSGEFSAQFDEMDPASRDLHIEVETMLKYEKQLRNLQLQEARLHRRREKAVAEITSVIKGREALRRTELDNASKLLLAAEHDGHTFNPADFGFEFSIDEIQHHNASKRAAMIARDQLMQPSRDLMSVMG